ncbi:hypothetical protein CFP56_022866 [Quercus suber]|uniref:Uncharacterized protein n=1 Tax=Quercus suber TaxID=58331 RepID=A0AAW0KA92_QUESU|nr:uncharacterized protein LOC112010416 [Quercus suber]POF20818.1 hypothetical protein CFP56_14332 [Quercus suber]
MARGSAAKTTKMLMLREAMRVDRGFSKHAGGADWHKKPASSINRGDNISYSPCWVPHPRTGIYCPKGQEWVMDDLPEQAASLNRTHWLRNVDGVDKADHNTPSDLYLHTNV